MKYGLIYSDPPWQYRDKCNSGNRGACHKYSVMDLASIKALPVSDLAADDCLLAMWWVAPMPDEALAVVRSWGFTLKTMKGFTWVKTNKEYMSDCIMWDKSVDKDGYGQVTSNGRTRRAHRVVWENHFGPIPDGLLVCHHCDNPGCVNIDHLFLGTNKDNIRDCVNKGRKSLWRPRGSDSPSAKLSHDHVEEIRRLLSSHSQTEIARQFGVTPSAISRIATGARHNMDLTLPNATLAVGMGSWSRANSEDCLFAVRGKPKRISASVHSIVMSARGAHSEKPAEVRDRLVQLVGDVPRLEMFARTHTLGWSAWGDEIESDVVIGSGV